MEEEIREEVLDNPLVVHKKSDASYIENLSDSAMNLTHTDDDSDEIPTLERHRFKKKKKNKKWQWVVIALIAVAVAVCCALYYSGVLGGNREETTQTTRKYYVTQKSEDFKGIITVKGTYIFFEGEEIDGIEGLDRAVKYLDSGQKFIVQDEKADEDFLNFQILSTLSKYNIDYEITHIVSSGLISKYETTEQTQTVDSTQASQAQSTTAVE